MGGDLKVGGNLNIVGILTALNFSGNSSGTNTGDQIVPVSEAGTTNNFLTAYNSKTGAWSKAQPTWANIDKTTSALSDLATRTVSNLSDGSNVVLLNAANNFTNTGVNAFAGNVGIGTTGPSYKLDVNGNTRITGNFVLGSTPSWLIDNSDGAVSILNIRARGATDSKALMRLMPQGNPSGDKSEFTLMGTDVDLANRWWADFKTSEESTTLRRLHLLTDREGTEQPITRVAFEIDGENESSALEEFSIVRNGWIGNTENGTGNGTFMFRAVGGTGITAIEQGTIQLATGNLVLGSTAGDVVANPVNSGAFRPFTDNTVSLGQTSYRWNSLRVGTADSSFGGNVGIGTTNPSYTLSLASGKDFGSESDLVMYAGTKDVSDIWLRSGTPLSYTDEVQIDTSANLVDFKGNTLYTSGNVGIGTTNPAYKLDVAGDINTTGDVRKGGAAYTNPDYVFAPDYNLMSLSDLKLFTQTNQHLPGVPSSEDIKQNGIALFEQTRLNLEKTEQAYLYLYSLNDQILALENKYASFSAQLATANNNVIPAQAGIQAGSPIESGMTDATISGALTVLAKTTLANLGVTGQITAGLLTIDGLNGEINSLAGPLKLQSLALSNLEIMAGKVIIDTHGNLTVDGTITAKEIQTNKLVILGSETTTIGEAVIPIGQTSVIIKNSAVTDNSRIFLTPKVKLGGSSLAVTSQTGADSFTVEMDNPADKDIKFNWWIIN